MHINIFNVDEFCKDLAEVTNSEELARNDFHDDGLFSKTIFGPESTAVCKCGVYHGRSKIGERCQECKMEINYSSERRKRFAKIVLPFKIINPIMYSIICKLGKLTIKTVIDNLLFSDMIYGYYYNKKFIPIKVIDIEENDDFEIPDGCTVYKGLSGIYQLTLDLCEMFKDDPNWVFVKDNLDKFYINHIIVSPPEFRPASKLKDDRKIDKINEYYKKILNFCSVKNKNQLEEHMISEIDDRMTKFLHRHVFNLYEYIMESFSKKKGMIRKFILGKRIDFSGRAVISPDPKLKLNQCSLPYLMILELYKLEISHLLLDKRLFKTIDSALERVDKCIEIEDYEYYDIIEKWIVDKQTMLNRQPTLHRLGILSFYIKLNKDYVIKIHPLVCYPYNADFDGDQMAVYKPLYDKTQQECIDKISIESNLISPTTGNASIGVNQDIVLGLYLLTMEDEKSKVIKKINNKDVITYKGRITFNSILPKGYPFINKIIDKKMLQIIINDIIKTKNKEESIEILDKIKLLGFECTTLYGCTLSLKNMNTDKIKKIADEIFNNDSLKWYEKLNLLKSSETINKVKKHFPYSVFIDSGSRGTWDQANQLILCRGYISNSKGKIIQEPIKSNLIDGLKPDEFFNSCYGARKGLLDIAINTGISGYLTRKLVYCTSNLELDETEDCGTDDGLELNINDSSLGVKSLVFAKSLVDRYAYIGNSKTLEKINYSDYEKIIGKKIKLRSPMFCKNKNVCKMCYGDTSNIIHSNYIGIIAAQALGEISTQLVLRTFHTSGVVAQISGTDGEVNQDIINDLTKVNKLFRCTIDDSTYMNILMELFKIYSEYSNVLFVHYECIVSQMMRYNNKRWRLYSDRKKENIEMCSIDIIPEKESFLLAIAFCKPKAYLINSILEKDHDLVNDGIMEKIMMNQTL